MKTDRRVGSVESGRSVGSVGSGRSVGSVGRVGRSGRSVGRVCRSGRSVGSVGGRLVFFRRAFFLKNRIRDFFEKCFSRDGTERVGRSGRSGRYGSVNLVTGEFSNSIVGL